MTVEGQSDVSIVIEPRSEDYDPNDPRWLDAVEQLKRDLKRALSDQDGALTTRERDAAGYKGGIEEIILALGTSGAISAAVVAFKAWLADGRKRQIVVTTRDGSQVTEVSVMAVGMSEEVVAERIRAALSPPKKR